MISLGANCHPAYWIRKLEINPIAYPFDWLLYRPEDGLKYVCWNIHNRFQEWLDDLSVNRRGYVISNRYPNVEFFHHPELINKLNELEQVTAHEKLVRRADRFLSSLLSDNNYLYVYTIQQEMTDVLLSHFKSDVESFLAVAPNARLHIYFMSNTNDLMVFKKCIKSLEAINERCFVYVYFRDILVHKTWGGAPDFLLSIKKEK